MSSEFNFVLFYIFKLESLKLKGLYKPTPTALAPDYI